MLKSLLKTLCRIAGKNQGKVIVVFATAPLDADDAVRYLRRSVPELPVWMFCLQTPAPKTSALCERVYVRASSARLLFAAERRVWRREVALTATRWNGESGHWAVKAAPFLIPPFRALVFNENNDFFPGSPHAVLSHLRARWFAYSRRILQKLGAVNITSNRKHETCRPYDVLVFPIIDWDWRTQRPQHLSLEFARRGHRVFYLSTKFLPAFGLSEPRARTVQKNIYVIELPAGDDPPDIYRDIPNELQLAALELGIQRLKESFNVGATISLVDYSFWGPLVWRLINNVVIYDCMDDYLSFSNAGRPAREFEGEMVQSADLILCSSIHLQERVRRLGRESILIRNAADPEHFGPRPASLAIQPDKPTVGFYGSITEFTDIDLLAYAARSLPAVRFIVIGRNDGGDLSALESLPNVILEGEIPYERLPEYVHGFDVGVVPYRICGHNLAIDPVKIWEYLCAGKPVVAVRFPEIERLHDLINLTETPRQFVDAIRSCLAGNARASVERRLLFARENTWCCRCDVIDAAIAPFFPKVSVVILSCNQRDFTERTLSAIDLFTAYPNLEVVLVDNGSTDGTPEFLECWAATHPYAKVILGSANIGFSAGNNVGIRASTGDYIVILNNDVCVTEGWVSTLLAHFRADPRLGLLGPVTNRCGNESVVYIGDYDDLEKMAILARRYTRARRGQRTNLRVANLFCAMMPRAIWNEVGELDEKFGIGLFEDDDYCMRLRSAGYSVMCAEDVFVHHHASATIGRLSPEAYSNLFERNRRYFESKWGAWVPPVFRKEVQDIVAGRDANLHNTKSAASRATNPF
jgi:GT2 family glycosyltransferase/glycosyltransferase involved in cell wall biosynthesis